MSSVHVPAIAAGEAAPCHPGRRLSGNAARCWCSECGRDFQARPAEIVPAVDDVVAAEWRVDRAAQVRAHELELERARHTPEYRPVREGVGSA